jgi:hypothetical protein
MKRLVLATLAVFCAAIVQVQPVEPLTTCQRACCHCAHPGACGMPSCRASTNPAPLVATAQSAQRGRAAARPLAQSGQFFFSVFPALRIEFAADPSGLAPSALAVPTAHAPLFKAHCSFLI